MEKADPSLRKSIRSAKTAAALGMTAIDEEGMTVGKRAGEKGPKRRKMAT